VHRRIRELSVTVVHEEEVAVPDARNEEIFVAIVVDVGKRRTHAGTVTDGHARGGRDVLESAATQIPVERIGATLIHEIQVWQAVVVHVGRRHRRAMVVMHGAIVPSQILCGDVAERDAARANAIDQLKVVRRLQRSRRVHLGLPMVLDPVGLAKILRDVHVLRRRGRERVGDRAAYVGERTLPLGVDGCAHAAIASNDDELLVLRSSQLESGRDERTNRRRRSGQERPPRTVRAVGRRVGAKDVGAVLVRVEGKRHEPHVVHRRRPSHVLGKRGHPLRRLARRAVVSGDEVRNPDHAVQVGEPEGPAALIFERELGQPGSGRAGLRRGSRAIAGGSARQENGQNRPGASTDNSIPVNLPHYSSYLARPRTHD